MSEFGQSAVIPYRHLNERIEVLLITSSDGERWIVPKGLLEPDITPAESAAKEALEEAGVKGRVGNTSIGEYHYEKWGNDYRVEVFLLEVEEELDDWVEAKLRQRKWMSVEDAVSIVEPDGLKDIVRDVAKHIDHSRW